MISSYMSRVRGRKVEQQQDYYEEPWYADSECIIDSIELSKSKKRKRRKDKVAKAIGDEDDCIEDMFHDSKDEESKDRYVYLNTYHEAIHSQHDDEEDDEVRKDGNDDNDDGRKKVKCVRNNKESSSRPIKNADERPGDIKLMVNVIAYDDKGKENRLTK
ncbi:hypothetical protein Tco_0183903 [Tanacetum coccineum]